MNKTVMSKPILANSLARTQAPGMGRLRASGKRWIYVPVNYTRMR